MANVTSKLNGEELTIIADGRIDSTNASDIETAIIDTLNNNPHQTVVLDLEDLEYISSAGLRIVLRLRKDEPTLKIINASSEVYEIFDMTGFTEMIPVEKAYRKISIEGCEVIGQGANGKVYRIDPDTIVKYYFNSDALPDIHRERELARKAFVLGIPTAIPYDVVKVGDGYGSVFELLNADSFVKLILKNPDDIDKYIGYSVDVLKKMHATDVNPEDMPDEKEVAQKWVNITCEHLPEETAKKLKKLFDDVPVSNKMMHGDYHIKNIMMQNGEVLLIDMDTLCHGNPIFEMSGIFNAYRGFSITNHANIEKFLGITFDVAQHILHKTFELYFETTDEAEIEMRIKQAAIAGYTRLLRRSFTRGNTPENIKFYQDELIRLVDEVDSIVM